MRNSLRCLIAGALAFTGMTVGCGDGGNDGTTNNPPPPEPDMAMAAKVCATGDFCTTTLDDQTLDLNALSQGSFMLMSNADYTGQISITVQRTALDALSGGKDPDVGIAVVPGIVQATPGTPIKVSVNVNTTTAAAAFTAMPITLHLQDTADATKSTDVSFKLTVNPNLTVTLTGDGVNTKHAWSTDNGNQVNIMVRQRPVVTNGNVKTGGTNFIFMNKDGNPHIIHGSGVITHQSTAGTGTPANGTYSVNNANDAVTRANTDGYYCHTHGQGSSTPGVERFVTFIP